MAVLVPASLPGCYYLHAAGYGRRGRRSQSVLPAAPGARPAPRGSEQGLVLSRDRRASPGAGASRLCPPQPHSSFSSCSLHRMWPRAWLVPALMREPGARCSRTETSEGWHRDTRHPLSPKAELTLGFPTSNPALLSWHSPQAPGKPRPLPSLARSHPKHRGAGKHDACRGRPQGAGGHSALPGRPRCLAVPG